MLAVEYTKNKPFFHSIGLYARKTEQHQIEHELKAIEQKVALGKNVCLSLRAQLTLHNFLAKVSMRHSGVIPNAELFAMQIKSGVAIVKPSSVTTAAAKKRKTKKESEATADIIPDEVYNELHMLFNILNRCRVKGQVIPIYTMDYEDFQLMIPPYISQLMPYFEVRVINMSGGYINVEDNLLTVFKRIIRVTDAILLKSLKWYDPDKHVLLNLTELSNKQLINKYKFKTLLDLLATRVTYRWKNVTSDVILLGADAHWRQKIPLGSAMIDNFKNLLLYGRVLDQTFNLLSRDSVCISVHPYQYSIVNQAAVSIGMKFLRQCENVELKKVNLVVIGNKGNGKSSFLRTYKQLLEEKFSDRIGHLSSDAYGRWYFKHYKCADPSTIEPFTVTYDEALLYDQDEFPSVYEIEMINLLKEHGVSKLKNILDHNFTLRSKIIDSFHSKYYTHLQSKSNNESRFYDQVIGSASCPRICIVEGHTVTQDPLLARTDTTIILETFIDARTALMERERETDFSFYYDDDQEQLSEYAKIAQVMLFLAYEELNSNVHTLVYPVDLIWAL